MLGVDFHSGKYRARCAGKLLGYFDRPDDAHAAYRAVAKPLTRGTKEVEAHNVERVRAYLATNLGCSRKEVIRALGLNSRTVAKAVRIIRGMR